jgi:hypothetical protein
MNKIDLFIKILLSCKTKYQEDDHFLLVIFLSPGGATGIHLNQRIYLLIAYTTFWLYQWIITVFKGRPLLLARAHQIQNFRTRFIEHLPDLDPNRTFNTLNNVSLFESNNRSESTTCFFSIFVSATRTRYIFLRQSWWRFYNNTVIIGSYF